MVEFRNRLYDLMAIKKITQSEIVAKTGISKSLVSLYLSGKRIPKQDKITLIAETYNVNPMWLMGYDVEMDSKKEKIKIDSSLEAENDFVLIEKFSQLNSRDKGIILDMIDTLLKK